AVLREPVRAKSVAVVLREPVRARSVAKLQSDPRSCSEGAKMLRAASLPEGEAVLPGGGADRPGSLLWGSLRARPGASSEAEVGAVDSWVIGPRHGIKQLEMSTL